MTSQNTQDRPKLTPGGDSNIKNDAMHLALGMHMKFAALTVQSMSLISPKPVFFDLPAHFIAE